MTTGRGDFFFNFERRNQSHNERHITHSIQEAQSVSNQIKYIHTLKYSTVSPNDIISSTFISKRFLLREVGSSRMMIKYYDENKGGRAAA
jgi:hypothetical protein